MRSASITGWMRWTRWILPFFREKLSCSNGEKLMNRSNEGLLAKKNVTNLQMVVLEPKLAILDETDLALTLTL